MPIVISKEAQRFAGEIGTADVLDLMEIECGLHSGFPKCCILFFVKVWRSCRPTPPQSYYSTMQALGVEPPGYIPCPTCLLAGNIVPVKPCACGRQRSLKLGL
jgi:hypothetical protein